jgi:hypothetical protein
VAVVDAKEVRFERFGGLNLRDDDIADHEARDLENVVGTPQGGVRTRYGSSVFNETALQSVLPAGYRFVDFWAYGYNYSPSMYGIGGGQFNKENKPALFAIAYDRADPTYPPAAGARAYALFGDGSVFDYGAINPYGGVAGQEGNGRLGIANGPNANVFINAAAPTASYFISPSSATLQTWSASAGSIPSGNVLKFWNNRMFITGIRNQAQRVQASTIGDASYWSTALDANGNRAWTLDLEPGDGDVIVGLAAFDTYLFVFKRRKVYVIYDADTGANRILTPNLGATSRTAITESPYGVIFQGSDYGLWLASGSGVRRLSDKVQPLCTSAGPVGYCNDHAYVCSPYMDTLDYDFKTEQWFKHSFRPTQFATQNFLSGQPPRLFGLMDPSSAGKNIWELFDGGVTRTDANTPFASWWAPAHNKFGTERKKRISELRVEGSGFVDVSFSKERQAETFQRSLTLSSPYSDYGDEWGQASVLTPGVARSWGFRFHSQSPNNAFSLDAYSANVEVRSD